MAAQPAPLTGPEAEARLARPWRAYQVFYHADQDRLLRHLVCPLLAELVRSRLIDRFFYTRYELGGPHLRLRWRLTDEAADPGAEAALAARAASVFTRWPSVEPVPEERIRRTNAALLSIDPLAGPEDDQVHPDNAWRRFPARFELARYGGPERLEASLDLFTLSSVHVLRLLQAHEGSPSGWVRPAFLRTALHLAWGLAGGQEGDLVPLAGYADRLWPDHFQASRAQGDAVFAKRGPELVDMARRELERAHEGTDGGIEGGSLAAGGCRLSSGLSGLDPDARWHVAASHVHMTANRFGLTNAEEVYLSRLLARVAGSVRHETPEAWKRVWEPRAVPASRPLEGLVAEALEGIAA